jgi:hypothetical protein
VKFVQLQAVGQDLYSLDDSGAVWMLMSWGRWERMEMPGDVAGPVDPVGVKGSTPSPPPDKNTRIIIPPKIGPVKDLSPEPAPAQDLSGYRAVRKGQTQMQEICGHPLCTEPAPWVLTRPRRGPKGSRDDRACDSHARQFKVKYGLFRGTPDDVAGTGGNNGQNHNDHNREPGI